MKKAISTLACDGWTLEKSLQVCVQNDIQAMEIRMGIHPWSQLNLTDEEYRCIYSEITAAGLIISDLGTSVVVQQYNEAALQEIERCAQIAQLWNCKGLRIMLGHFRISWSESMQELDYAGIIRWIQEADARMAYYGTEIWIETHNEFATGESLNQILKDSGVKRCKLIWDIMHPLESGEQPEDSFKYMSPHLVHVHIKDGQPWLDTDLANYQYTHIGTGVIPIEAIIRLLQKNNYDGFYSMEWEGKWRKELQQEGFDAENEIAIFSKLIGKIESTLVKEGFPGK
jgi:sugar phosphate isomerase/epimerase